MKTRPPIERPRRCRICGCTETDCSQCIALTGAPCHWVGPDLCSACVDLKAKTRKARPAAKRKLA